MRLLQILLLLVWAYLAWLYGLVIVMVMTMLMLFVFVIISGGAALYAYVDVIHAEGRQTTIPIIGSLILTVVFMGLFLGLVGMVPLLISRAPFH